MGRDPDVFNFWIIFIFIMTIVQAGLLGIAFIVNFLYLKTKGMLQKNLIFLFIMALVCIITIKDSFKHSIGLFRRYNAGVNLKSIENDSHQSPEGLNNGSPG